MTHKFHSDGNDDHDRGGGRDGGTHNYGYGHDDNDRGSDRDDNGRGGGRDDHGDGGTHNYGFRSGLLMPEPCILELHLDQVLLRLRLQLPLAVSPHL
jgi:hypothetical protein